MSVWKLCTSVCAIILLSAAIVYSTEPDPSKPVSAENSLTTITAQKMTVRNQESRAIFEGKVVLTRGALVVHSDTMVVFFKPSEPSVPEALPGKARQGGGDLPIMANRSVSTIEATGRVRIEKDDGRATSNKAVYYADEEKIVLTGGPVAWQKGTRVTGKKITMYLAEDRSVVEGGSRVLIDQSEEGGR